MSGQDIADQLAAWRHSAPAMRDTTAIGARLTDAVLCALAADRATGDGLMQRIRSYTAAVAGTGTATEWGTGARTDAFTAALVNGVAVRALDLNDTHVASGIAHPSDAIPALVALSETHNRPFDDLLDALTATYESICRLNEVVSLRSHGWEAATITGLGVVVGGSLLLQLDDETTAQALRLAAMLAPALRCTRTGQLSDWKAISSPRAAVEGMHALIMAQHGISPPQHAFTDPDGFVNRVTGPFSLPSDGTPRVPATLMKLYPAQVFIQDILRTTRFLLADEALGADQVEGIRVDTFERCATLVGGGVPLDANGAIDAASADHSLQACLATLIHVGRLGPEAFERAAADDGVRRLAEAVDVRIDAEAEAAYPTQLRSVVHVDLVGGRQLRGDTSKTPPVEPTDLGAKFKDMVSETPTAWPWEMRGAPPFPDLGVRPRKAEGRGVES